MKKTSYPVNILNAKKINKKKIKFINDSISVRKYQNVYNKSYGPYKPTSKMFKFND